MNNPNYQKLIEYVRGSLAEQVHFGIVIHLNKSGLINKIGDDNGYKFYHRSCMKPLQVSPIIDLGLDKKYNFSEEEIAVCCASHTGDKIHQKYIYSVLEKIGLTEDSLLCPEHEPLSKKEQMFLCINSLKPGKIHNNCSGKHAAMLAICKEKHFSLNNYKSFEHPLSTLIINKVCNLCEIERKDAIISKDGCGLPVIATSLESLGKGFLNLFTDKKYDKITNAFLNHPFLIGGEYRLDTQIIQYSENVIAKVGAGGLCVIVNIGKQEAIVIKIADSNMDARALSAFSVLKQLNWIKNIDSIPIQTEITTLDNEKIGTINVCFDISQ